MGREPSSTMSSSTRRGVAVYREPIVLALALTLPVPAGVAASTDGAGLCLEYAAIDTTETLDGVVEVMTARMAQAGSTDATVVATGTGTIEVELPTYTAATDDAEAIAQRLAATGHLAFRPVPSELTHELEAGQPLPEAMAAAAPLFDGASVVSAQAGIDEFLDDPTLELQFDDVAARLLDEYAAEHLYEQIAITLDDTIISAPTLNASSFEGRVTIVGGLEPLPVDELVAQLTTGTLPLEIELLSAGACEDEA